MMMETNKVESQANFLQINKVLFCQGNAYTWPNFLALEKLKQFQSFIQKNQKLKLIF